MYYINSITFRNMRTCRISYRIRKRKIESCQYTSGMHKNVTKSVKYTHFISFYSIIYFLYFSTIIFMFFFDNLIIKSNTCQNARTYTKQQKCTCLSLLKKKVQFVRSISQISMKHCLIASAHGIRDPTWP